MTNRSVDMSTGRIYRNDLLGVMISTFSGAQNLSLRCTWGYRRERNKSPLKPPSSESLKGEYHVRRGMCDYPYQESALSAVKENKPAVGFMKSHSTNTVRAPIPSGLLGFCVKIGLSGPYCFTKTKCATACSATLASGTFHRIPYAT